MGLSGLQLPAFGGTRQTAPGSPDDKDARPLTFRAPAPPAPAQRPTRYSPSSTRSDPTQIAARRFRPADFPGAPTGLRRLSVPTRAPLRVRLRRSPARRASSSRTTGEGWRGSGRRAQPNSTSPPRGTRLSEDSLRLAESPSTPRFAPSPARALAARPCQLRSRR